MALFSDREILEQRQRTRALLAEEAQLLEQGDQAIRAAGAGSAASPEPTGDEDGGGAEGVARLGAVLGLLSGNVAGVSGIGNLTRETAPSAAGTVAGLALGELAGDAPVGDAASAGLGERALDAARAVTQPLTTVAGALDPVAGGGVVTDLARAAESGDRAGLLGAAAGGLAGLAEGTPLAAPLEAVEGAAGVIGGRFGDVLERQDERAQRQALAGRPDDPARVRQRRRVAENFNDFARVLPPLPDEQRLAIARDLANAPIELSGLEQGLLLLSNIAGIVTARGVDLPSEVIARIGAQRARSVSGTLQTTQSIRDGYLATAVRTADLSDEEAEAAFNSLFQNHAAEHGPLAAELGLLNFASIPGASRLSVQQFVNADPALEAAIARGDTDEVILGRLRSPEHLELVRERAFREDVPRLTRKIQQGFRELRETEPELLAGLQSDATITETEFRGAVDRLSQASRFTEDELTQIFEHPDFAQANGIFLDSVTREEAIQRRKDEIARRNTQLLEQQRQQLTTQTIDVVDPESGETTTRRATPEGLREADRLFAEGGVSAAAGRAQPDVASFVLRDPTTGVVVDRQSVPSGPGSAESTRSLLDRGFQPETPRRIEIQTDADPDTLQGQGARDRALANVLTARTRLGGITQLLNRGDFEGIFGIVGALTSFGASLAGQAPFGLGEAGEQLFERFSGLPVEEQRRIRTTIGESFLEFALQLQNNQRLSNEDVRQAQRFAQVLSTTTSANAARGALLGMSEIAISGIERELVALGRGNELPAVKPGGTPAEQALSFAAFLDHYNLPVPDVARQTDLAEVMFSMYEGVLARRGLTRAEIEGRPPAEGPAGTPDARGFIAPDPAATPPEDPAGRAASL